MHTYQQSISRVLFQQIHLGPLHKLFIKFFPFVSASLVYTFLTYTILTLYIGCCTELYIIHCITQNRIFIKKFGVYRVSQRNLLLSVKELRMKLADVTLEFRSSETTGINTYPLPLTSLYQCVCVCVCVCVCISVGCKYSNWEAVSMECNFGTPGFTFQRLAC